MLESLGPCGTDGGISRPLHYGRIAIPRHCGFCAGPLKQNMTYSKIIVNLQKVPEKGSFSEQNIYSIDYLCCNFVSEFGGGKSNGGFSEGRFVLKPDAAIASKVSISSKNSLVTTDFLTKTTHLVNHCENPLSGTAPIRDSQRVSVTTKTTPYNVNDWRQHLINPWT